MDLAEDRSQPDRTEQLYFRYEPGDTSPKIVVYLCLLFRFFIQRFYFDLDFQITTKTTSGPSLRKEILLTILGTVMKVEPFKYLLFSVCVW